jgi:DNA-binding winged helix-turn-helix (wHTH) protein
MKLSFEECAFDGETREVSRRGGVVALSPKAFALLELLISSRPKAVSKARIQDELWPATHVSEGNLANLVMELRSGLGDDALRPRIIRTLPRFGYAFCANADQGSQTANSPSAAPGLAHRLIWGRREIALNSGENRIGRDQHAVVWIDDTSVSRRHARIVIDEGGAANLEDLGSKNGTLLNNRRIRRATPLSDGDELRIGSASMTFRVLRSTGSTLSNVKETRSE